MGYWNVGLHLLSLSHQTSNNYHWYATHYNIAIFPTAQCALYTGVCVCV